MLSVIFGKCKSAYNLLSLAPGTVSGHSKWQLVLLGLFQWNPGLPHGHRDPQIDLIPWVA